MQVLDEAYAELSEDAQLVHYLARPPSTVQHYTRAIAAHGLAEDARVVYEKPYGTSWESFEPLDQLVQSVFDEQQVFRIDHVLGKEATQQLHVLRFANRMIEQLWSNEHVAQVQIDVPEVLGVDDCATFYDATGATLDMFVTHLLQVAAEVALDPPADWTSQGLAQARGDVLAQFRPLGPRRRRPRQSSDYRQLREVDDGSVTDTFLAARLWVDTDRWRGVPLVLRTDKKLAQSHQRVTLVLQPASGHPRAAGKSTLDPETITLSLSGNGSVWVDITARRPGVGDDLVTGRLSLDPAQLPGAHPLPPCAALLRNVLTGDLAPFTPSARLRAAWRVVTPVLRGARHLHVYDPDSRGPRSARALAAPYGWLRENRAVAFLLARSQVRPSRGGFDRPVS